MFRNPLIDFAVVVIAALLIFGPKRLPTLGRGLGQGMKEFKDGITGKSPPVEEASDERPELTAASTPEQPGGPVAPREGAELGSSEPRS